jgi:tRNA 5-methylaminomethyl-2-thiouridine biosynthesis bifunctional protein
MARASREGATFGTFTAAGQVRRDLAAAGFRVERVAGYGRKRECLAGALQSSPREEAHGWDIETGGQSVPERVLVLGAGLAGSFAAHALARRGVEVTVLDTAGVASGGSGNEQGVLYTRLSRRHSPLVDFALQSYCHALNAYRGMFASNILETGHDGELCGCFHQHGDEEELRALQPLLGDVADFAQVLDAVTANGLLGIEQAAGGFWHPGSGWLHPPAVCRALLDAPGVDLREHCGPLTLVREDGRWQARTKREVIAQAPCAIVATGVATAAMPGLEWLPLQAIRGQTTLLPATDALSRLRAALCHEGYVTPARTGTHCVGATFDPGDMEPSLRKADHRLNLERLGRAVPGWQDELAALDPQCIEGRVGWRCASPDYLPMVGPVPDREAFLEDFAALRRNAKTVITGRGRYLPGLYLNTAHGSRGLTSTPLAAELLASLVCCEPPPVCRELSRALAPARFIIRDLSRNRI